MFRVGDKISYPMHGAGSVVSIEQRDEDEKTSYYSLFFYGDGLKVMVPTNKATEVGMRPVIDAKEAESVFAALSQAPEAEDSNWNRRYRANLDKLRTGTPWAIARVLGALSARNQARGLSASEKKILVSARRFLLGELLLAGVGSEEDINARIDDCLACAKPLPQAKIG